MENSIERIKREKEMMENLNNVSTNILDSMMYRLAISSANDFIAADEILKKK